MIYVLLIAAIVIGDQIAKYFTVTNLPVGGSVTFIPGFMDFTHVRNTGAAFSLFSNGTWLLALLSAVMAVVVIFLLFKYKKQANSKLFNIAMAFIAGGAIGNLIDRIVQGYVTDMMQFSFVNFAVFNVADCFVTFGAVMLGIWVLWFWDRHKKTETKDGSTKEQG
ncbi:signal peptidase II [Christensenella intestinihominis]|uniref:signal peptidase II n=1 Tax=Christensenella intestinihominis TaxID=1851429 RepID=UPI00082B7526|nr:signal peptidase II [Christensenella intestinihominis]